LALQSGRHPASAPPAASITSAYLTSTSAQPTVPSIELSKNTGALAVDPSSHTAYVTNPDDGTVSVIDTVSRKISSVIPVAADPKDIAVDSSGHTVYVTSFKAGRISAIDTTTGAVTTVSLPAGFAPERVAVDTTAHILFAAGVISHHVDAVASDSEVIAIDIASQTLVATTPLGQKYDTIEIDDLAIDPANHSAYLAYDHCIGSQPTCYPRIDIIDTLTHVVTGSIGENGPSTGTTRRLAVDPSTHQLYCIEHENKDIRAFDPMTHEATLDISVPSSPEALALDISTHRAYVVDGAALVIVDLNGEKVISRTPLAGDPEFVAVDPIRHAAYVTNSSSGTLSILAG
jgi:YVTN family beta-propeller protein